LYLKTTSYTKLTLKCRIFFVYLDMQNTPSFSIKESISELKSLRLKQPSLTKQKRVDCLLYLKMAKFNTRQDLADYLGVHIRTQERWLVIYQEEGIDSMLTNKPKNKASKIITQQVHDGLKARVNSPEAPLLGYWDAQRWVEEEFGVKVKYHWLRAYMIKRFKTKLKTPRKNHIKKDEQAVAAFLKTT